LNRTDSLVATFLAVIFLSCIAAMIRWAGAKYFTTVPIFSAGFNIAMLAYLTAVSGGIVRRNSVPPPPIIAGETMTAAVFFEAWVLGVSQFAFVDEYGAAIVVLVALFITSRKAVVGALLGSLVGLVRHGILLSLLPLCPRNFVTVFFFFFLSPWLCVLRASVAFSVEGASNYFFVLVCLVPFVICPVFSFIPPPRPLPCFSLQTFSWWVLLVPRRDLIANGNYGYNAAGAAMALVHLHNSTWPAWRVWCYALFTAMFALLVQVSFESVMALFPTKVPIFLSGWVGALDSPFLDKLLFLFYYFYYCDYFIIMIILLL
jgi:hypothetical protein